MPVFTGTTAADRIVGSAEADQIYGLGLNDMLYGGGGDDWLVGGLGGDFLVGGLGDDSYDVDSIRDQVVERAFEGTDRVRAWISYELTANVEILTLAGTANLNGTGNAKDNTITGNAGNNVLDGGAGDDVLIGGRGNDAYYVNSAGDLVVEAAGEGRDQVRALISYQLRANFEDLILGGTGNLIGTGNALDNTIIGNAGNNVLNGGAGVDILIGRGGNDIYDVDSIFDRIQEAAGEGYDRVRASVSFILGANIEELNLVGTDDTDGIGNALANTIIGSQANNTIEGGAGDDILYGGDGDDYLIGGAGVDRLSGGAGNDRINIRNGIDDNFGEIYSGGLGNDTIETGSFSRIDLFKISLHGIERLYSMDTDVVNISTIQLKDFKQISAYKLVVSNSGDIDLSNLTNSYIHSLELNNFGNAVTVGSNNFIIRGGSGNDIIVGNDFSIGNGGDDTLIAAAHRSRLNGGSGDDILRGGAGDDLLHDGVGADDVIGGGGNDILYLLKGDSVAGDYYDGGAGRDELNVDSTVTFDLSPVQIVGFEYLDGRNIIINANQLNSFDEISAYRIVVKSSGVVDFRDVDLLYIREIYLSSAGNTLEMGPGGFFVFGGSGNDVIVGSAYGADVSGGDGDDIIIGKADYDILDGQAGNDRIEGNGAGDSLRGGTGADHLMGGDGNDELIGGAGNDLLVGGAGSDDFRFKALSDGRDTISDFNSAQGDVLVFANLLHGTFSYRGTAAFTASGNSEARFEGGTVLCDIDGNGIANITIVLTGITAATQLTAADFAIW